ncbi:SDR family NAD(P)-dependent oxidoreductase [Aquimarina megaterium]|uniref:SDR family NAD(P)-dependent oxidoreductase n=1 Tax=Aquimarina megaterium TaxID=1443666 RepID=UPI00047077E5|nr:SDR family oxidoreductase [Aquimarina megaterium]
MNNFSLDKKIFLITGTSKGIGRYLAEYYLKDGNYVIGCSRSKSDLVNDKYTHFEKDVANETDVLEIFRFIRKHYKRIDVLINNAAINPRILTAGLLPYKMIEDTYKVNVYAPMIFCREAIKLMSRKKYGRIINMSSMAVKHEVRGESLYTSTKSAITAYTNVISKEIYDYGITANVIAPSAIPTDLSAKIDQEALQEVLSRNAIKSLGEMKDVSNAIDFVISEDSSSITGQVIYLGGV